MVRRRKLSFWERSDTGALGERDQVPLTNHRAHAAKDHWDYSSMTPRSQSSEENLKASTSSITEVKNKFPATTVNFLTSDTGHVERRRKDNGSNPFTGTFTSMSNMFSFWGERKGSRSSESQRRSMSAHANLGTASSLEDRARIEVESRLEMLHAQLNRLETRMTADINIILQLLQRQAVPVPVPVPPAYSAVSPTSHPSDMYSPLSAGSRESPSAQPATPLQASPLESPCYAKSEKVQVKSREALSSGAQLTVAPDQTATLHPLPGHQPQPPLGAQLQRPAPSAACFNPSRFPSFPEHLGSSGSQTDMKRHVSDPVLPGS